MRRPGQIYLESAGDVKVNEGQRLAGTVSGRELWSENKLLSRQTHDPLPLRVEVDVCMACAGADREDKDLNT